jgi:hypothetical protein
MNQEGSPTGGPSFCQEAGTAAAFDDCMEDDFKPALCDFHTSVPIAPLVSEPGNRPPGRDRGAV